jgi:enoyl-CoA hydratase
MTDSAADEQYVTLERDGNVAILTLDDPGRRNALPLEVIEQIKAAVAEASADESVGALVVTATPPVFCSGGSVDDLLNPRAPLRHMYGGFESIQNCPLPTVAAVNGPAVGAGVSVALACDVVLCSPEARFDPRFLDVGIHPGGGTFFKLQRLVGPQGAAAMVLFGEAPQGEDAVRVGLAWKCLPVDELLPAAIAMARRAADRNRALVLRAKQTHVASQSMSTAAEALDYEYEAQAWSQEQPVYKANLEKIRERLGRT